MNTYINGFMRGRDLLKKLLICDLITAALAIVVFSLLFHVTTPKLVLAIAACCIAVFQHRANIKRLSEGTEADFKAAETSRKE